MALGQGRFQQDVVVRFYLLLGDYTFEISLVTLTIRP